MPEGSDFMTNLETIDAETLLSQPVRRPPFVVEDLLASGLYILAGAPKVGKSWLALWLCTWIASGKPVWKFAVRSSTVLYLCLEDNRQRIQIRLSEMVGSEADDFSSLHFSTEAQMLTGSDRGEDTGLLRQIHEFTDKHPDTRLIIIDTLQKVRTAAGVSCSCDYNDLSLLKSFADRHRLTILFIHHLRKMKDDDPLNRISGTTGIAGAADGTLVLIRSKRSENGAILHCTGRDIQTRELALEFRACLKIVNTPKQRAFFCHTSLNFLAIRQDACENLPCLAKNSSLLGISPIIKQALIRMVMCGSCVRTAP